MLYEKPENKVAWPMLPLLLQIREALLPKPFLTWQGEWLWI